MSVPTLTLRAADRDRLDVVADLLDANDLPSADVRSKPECFYLGYVDGDPVCAGGIEPHGDVGLLRSVVVDESVRGEGYGTAVCDELESRASEDGLEALYLLTTTAAAFFAARGYEEIDRGDAPTAIRESSQFQELCPDSATCLAKSLP